MITEVLGKYAAEDRSQALEDLKREKCEYPVFYSIVTPVFRHLCGVIALADEKGSVFLTGLLGMAWIMGR